MAFYVGQECGDLREVIVGRCADFATISQSQLAIDPVSKLHIKRHDMPSHEAINREMDQVVEVLENNGVLVKRPLEMEGVCPLFLRDVACVIDDVFFRTNTISERAGEFAAIESIADQEPFQIRQFSPSVRLEGGMPCSTGNIFSLAITMIILMLTRLQERTVALLPLLNRFLTEM